MSKKYYNVSLEAPYIKQTSSSTWDGFKELWSDFNLSHFKNTGCALCSLTMVTAYLENKFTMLPVTLAKRAVINRNDPTVRNWDNASRKFDISKETSNCLSKIAQDIIINGYPVVVEVPGHFVVAYGIRGYLPLDPDGNPYYNSILSSMILVADPYHTKQDTLEKVLDYRGGNVKSIRRVIR